jgi:M6 family metalloprotease-like protein
MIRLPRRFFVFPARLRVLAALLALQSALGLQPPREGEFDTLIREGKLERRMESALRMGNHEYGEGARERIKALLGSPAASASLPEAYRQLSSQLPNPGPLPTTGIVHTLTILIDFADHRAETEFPGLTPSRIHANLYGSGTATAADYAPHDSLKRYYERASEGQLHLTGRVLGWYHFPGRQTDYASLDADDNRRLNFELVAEALSAYDSSTDFSIFDNDNDGFIDAVNVIWVGEKGPWSSFWWGYRWSFDPADTDDFLLDGKQLRDFTWQWLETREDAPDDYDPRVPIHEFGHLLGLPDLYDYSPHVGPPGGTGNLDVMDNSSGGNHNGFHRWMLGWINPWSVEEGQLGTVPLRTADANAPGAMPGMVVYFKNHDIAEYDGGSEADPLRESLFIENRTRSGNDAGIAETPGDGILIWHVNPRVDNRGYFVFTNHATDRKFIRLIQADGLNEIERLVGDVDAEDYFKKGDALGPHTNPDSGSDTIRPSRIVIEVNSDPGPVMEVGLARWDGPLLQVIPGSIHDSVYPGINPPPFGLRILTQTPRENGSLDSQSGVLSLMDKRPLSASESTRRFSWSVDQLPTGIHTEELVITAANPDTPPVRLPVTLNVRVPLEDATGIHGHYIQTGLSTPWYGQMETVASPPFAVEASGLEDDRHAYLRAYYYVARDPFGFTSRPDPSIIRFKWKASTELDKDMLHFQINGQTVRTISGETGWEDVEVVHQLDPGSGWNALQWVYIKDEAGSAGEDAVWVDDISVTPISDSPFFREMDFTYPSEDPYAFDARPSELGISRLEQFAYAGLWPDNPFLDERILPSSKIVSKDGSPYLQFEIVRDRTSVADVILALQGSVDGLHWYTFFDGLAGASMTQEFGQDPEHADWYRTLETWLVPAEPFRLFRIRLSLP